MKENGFEESDLLAITFPESVICQLWPSCGSVLIVAGLTVAVPLGAPFEEVMMIVMDKDLCNCRSERERPQRWKGSQEAFEECQKEKRPKMVVMIKQPPHP